MRRVINQIPAKPTNLFLNLLPFLLIILIYTFSSNEMTKENPNQKILPSFEKCATTMHKYIFEPSKRTGEYVLLNDTTSSLKRLVIGVTVSAVIALVFGIVLGMIPYMNSLLSPLVWTFSLIPTMAILPILFIIFGLGELSKIVLIIFGVAPIMIREIYQRVREIPIEQIIKVQTLGANSWQIIVRIIIPQILPRLVDAIRITLGTAWIFLISAEAIASTEGLGYRIFLVRRYLAMDVIIPYVIWITLIAFLMDYLLNKLNYKLFPWFGKE
ncbi:ABC transporter permease [Halarcobacter anaerophilus]|uniref:Lipid kinase n=1 Tax=Halarcobacter anaerophilus TaxID=877500 RepID=A0A4Q0Y3J3_9BACT|nr:ABC transporter permease subunit [Halarcobacter anaerophilus]QDF29458.1 urea ABC transporter, permease protein [Halarcobacter anaerophilus]RXJ64702.1 lipid kinase [Halarcobacter anaerophilus]